MLVTQPATFTAQRLVEAADRVVAGMVEIPQDAVVVFPPEVGVALVGIFHDAGPRDGLVAPRVQGDPVAAGIVDVLFPAVDAKAERVEPLAELGLGHDVEYAKHHPAQLLPQRPELAEPFGDELGVVALPVAEVDLPQDLVIVADDRSQGIAFDALVTCQARCERVGAGCGGGSRHRGRHGRQQAVPHGGRPVPGSEAGDRHRAGVPSALGEDQPTTGADGIRPWLRAKTGSRLRPGGGGPRTNTLRAGGVGRVRRKPSSLEIHSSAGSAIGYSFASKILRSVVRTKGSASHWSIVRPAVAMRFIALAATDRWKYCQVTSSIMSQALSAPN